MIGRLITSAGLLVFIDAAQASPPLAPPAKIIWVAREITRTFNARDLSSYGNLFGTDLKVYFGGRTVAANKAQWLSQVAYGFRTRLQKSTVRSIGVGFDTILIFEMRSDNPVSGTAEGVPTPLAASYKMRGGKIVELRFLGGASQLINP